jgi:hypothetical protein
MSWLDRLFGRRKAEPAPQTPLRTGPGRPRPTQSAMSPDEQAIARYRYMLQTAPPETVEQAHAEAFAKLTPEQRAQVLQSLAQDAPPNEQQLLQQAQNDPQALARVATRAEMRRPGTLERSFGSPAMGGGVGMGGIIAGSLLSSIAGAFIGTAIAQSFFDTAGDPLAEDAGAEDAGAEDAGAEDVGAEEGGDFGGGDFGGFGGGDFGGGDFGGGDFGGEF